MLVPWCGHGGAHKLLTSLVHDVVLLTIYDPASERPSNYSQKNNLLWFRGKSTHNMAIPQRATLIGKLILPKSQNLSFRFASQIEHQMTLIL